MNKKMVSYRFLPELLNIIKIIAQKEGTSKTGIIEKCIEFYICEKKLNIQKSGVNK